MPFGSATFHWNSVDVRGGDGLLHHGKVVDVAPGNLLVDFGGAQSGDAGRRLIPFGQIYRCKQWDCLHWRPPPEAEPEWREGPLVEVLLREKPADRWKWYSGVLVYYFSNSGCGLVSVTLPNRQLSGIAAEHRLRLRSTEGWLDSLRVTPGQFFKKMVLVPSKMDDAAELIGVLNYGFQKEHAWMMAVEVVPNLLVKLVIGVGINIMGVFHDPNWLFRCLFEWARPEPLLSVHRLSGMLVEKDDPLNSIRLLFPQVASVDGNIQSLCNDVLIEMFQCMDALQQMQRRGVCRAWEAALTSPGIQRVLAISFHTALETCDFPACLYYAWSHQTKVLVLYECGVWVSSESTMADTSRLLERVMTARQLPALQTVLVANMGWEIEANHSNWMGRLHRELMALTEVCATVSLRSVGAELRFHPSDCDEEVTRVQVSAGRITRDLTVKDLWTLLNDQLPDLQADDMAGLSAWIHLASTCPTTDLWLIAQIINNTQALDARDGVRYHGVTFYPYGVSSLAGIDTKRLSKLTLHKLLNRYKDRRSADDWSL